MGKSYHTIANAASAELIEKKSRFIGYTKAVASEEEAYAFVEQIKKMHYDARHNCFAFSVGVEQPLLRFSDDGEPQGTAGKPILEVLTGACVTNVCIVVTRYFGGTLLGTGGLVRAYTEAAKQALLASGIIEKTQVQKVVLEADYTDWGRLQYMIAEQKYVTLQMEYADTVHAALQVPAEQVDTLAGQITELTSARSVLTKEGEAYWA